MLYILLSLFLFVSISVALEMQCDTVWLTVSSLREDANDQDDKLEINWNDSCQSDPDFPNIVKVFDADPTTDPVPEAILILNIKDHSESYYRSNISVCKAPLPGGWNDRDEDAQPGSHCFQHYAGFYINDVMVNSSCLRIRPTWMYDSRQEIGRLPIGKLMIPGTHDSGSYERANMALSEGLERWLLSQDRNIWTQLVHGIRYLDIRVGYYSSALDFLTDDSKVDYIDKFWVNHDIIQMTRLSVIIKDLKNFLDVSKGEIVIIDLHKFPVGFNDKRIHHRLVSVLKRSFGDLILEPDLGIDGFGPTLNDIWNRGKRLIICYGDNQTMSEYDWLWPPLSQLWGNQQKPEGLFKYLNETLMGDGQSRNYENPLWAVMAELTPKRYKVLFAFSGDLRQMADSVNRNLSVLFRNDWWIHTNVVATDFFLGNNLIDTSIQANIKKSNIT